MTDEDNNGLDESDNSRRDLGKSVVADTPEVDPRDSKNDSSAADND